MQKILQKKYSVYLYVTSYLNFRLKSNLTVRSANGTHYQRSIIITFI